MMIRWPRWLRKRLPPHDFEAEIEAVCGKIEQDFLFERERAVLAEIRCLPPACRAFRLYEDVQCEHHAEVLWVVANHFYDLGRGTVDRLTED